MRVTSLASHSGLRSLFLVLPEDRSRAPDGEARLQHGRRGPQVFLRL